VKTDAHMMHGTDWTDDIDPSGWLISEKLDGCRAFWDGAQLWSRGGKAILTPAWFTVALPSFALDGEVWAGRGRFEEARLAVQYGKFSRRCRFMVFDVPHVRGAWLARMQEAARALRGCPAARPVAVTFCKDSKDLLAKLTRVQRIGGEGLMIREPSALYTPGRVRTMLKVK
jgi:DNA ligase-1